MNYNKEPLGSLCLKVSSGGTPKSTNAEYYDGGTIPWLNTKEVNFCRIYNTEKKITQLGLDNSAAKIIEPNRVIVAMYGATAARVAINKIELSTNQACCNLKIDPNKADYEYVYYCLLNEYERLASLANGGAQQNLNSLTIKNFKIPVPDLKIQKKIVRILSALDQKIELNNQQSKVLETAAFTLYDDLINNIDESNFKKVAIGQIADCKLGGTPSRAKTEYWGGSINWINSGAINSFRITGPSELITEEGFKHTSTYMLPKGTTVLAITGATLGQVSRMEIEGCANQSVIGIVGNNVISNEYIYLTIVRNIQKIINRQTGGAQQHINKNDIKEFEIILPNRQLMNDFTNKVRPIFEKIAQNEFENKTLSSLRDAILPKLMSGEINLDKAMTDE